MRQLNQNALDILAFLQANAAATNLPPSRKEIAAPNGILLIGIICAAWLVLWYRGRAHLVRVQTLAQLTMQVGYPPPAQIAGAMPLRAVWLVAHQRGLVPVEQDGTWLLVDADGVPRSRMLPAPADATAW